MSKATNLKKKEFGFFMDCPRMLQSREITWNENKKIVFFVFYACLPHSINLRTALCCIFYCKFQEDIGNKFDINL